MVRCNYNGIDPMTAASTVARGAVQLAHPGGILGMSVSLRHLTDRATLLANMIRSLRLFGVSD
jgi:2-methylaconitate cis-trans-isomerase PrpF